MARPRWHAAVGDAAVAAGVAAVVVGVAAAAFRAAAGAAIAAVEAFREEATAGAVTLEAAGAAMGAVMAGVTFPAPPLAEAIFPRPTFQEATSQAPRAHRDPAAAVSHRAARSVLRPELVRPAAERPNCPRGIGPLPVVRAVGKELVPRNNRPAAQSRPEAKPVKSRPGNLRSVRRKVARVIFLAPSLAPALVPLSAAD
jgi:hypothetical protein